MALELNRLVRNLANLKNKETAKDPHAWTQKGEAPEEAEIGRTITTF